MPVSPEIVELFKTLYAQARLGDIACHQLVVQTQQGELICVSAPSEDQATDRLVQALSERGGQPISGLIITIPSDEPLPPYEDFPQSHYFGSKLEVPGYYLRTSLLQLNRENGQALVFCIGEDRIVVHPLSFFFPAQEKAPNGAAGGE